jgi:hypothetical protein
MSSQAGPTGQIGVGVRSGLYHVSEGGTQMSGQAGPTGQIGVDVRSGLYHVSRFLRINSHPLQVMLV